MTAEEILQQLDTQFEIVHHDPPHLYQLSSHFFPADTRLTAFHATDCWAIVFEILGYWNVSQTVRLDIFVYSSRDVGSSARYESTPFQILGPTAGDPRHFSILWNDQRYDFAPSDRDYAEAGIAFDPTRSNPDAHANARIVRYLCDRLNHPFFLPEESLRDLVTQNRMEDVTTPAGPMTVLLQTRTWRHPDLSQEELPSQVKSFQILAHALETGDTSEWGHQDPASFNTDWRPYDWEEKAQEEQQREWEARQDAVWDVLPPEAQKRITDEAGAASENVVIEPHGRISDEDASV